jgi:hypothetical protein
LNGAKTSRNFPHRAHIENIFATPLIVAAAEVPRAMKSRSYMVNILPGTSPFALTWLNEL